MRETDSFRIARYIDPREMKFVCSIFVMKLIKVMKLTLKAFSLDSIPQKAGQKRVKTPFSLEKKGSALLPFSNSNERECLLL